MLQVRRVEPYDPNLPHPARGLGQLHDTVHVQSALYCKCYNLATHKPLFMLIQTTLFLTDEHLKNLKCHRCGGWGHKNFLCPHPPAKVATKVCMATKALSHTGWLQHKGTFICYAWPLRPSATQADYSITALLLAVLGYVQFITS